MKFDKPLWSEFDYLEPINSKEGMIMITRQHIALIILRVFAVLFVCLTAWGASIYATNNWISDVNTNKLIMFATFGFISIIIMLFTLYFHNYYMSGQVITTDRILDIDQRGLLKRELNEVFFNNIQSINYEQNGIFALILNFGNVVVQSAGRKTERNLSGFVFENIPNPKEVSRELSKLYDVEGAGGGV